MLERGENSYQMLSIWTENSSLNVAKSAYCLKSTLHLIACGQGHGAVSHFTRYCLDKAVMHLRTWSELDYNISASPAWAYLMQGKNGIQLKLMTCYLFYSCL